MEQVDTNKVVCPLCKGNKVKIVDTIVKKDLNDLYLATYNMDITYIFEEQEIYFFKCEDCYLKFFYPSVIGDERFYKVLQKTDLYYMEEKEEYTFASKFISAADDILDVGCGKGVFLKK